MLNRLVINNYALIHELETEFPNGLTTITGSTGAGKSIMLGALSLLMGARADVKKIARPDVKTTVEGEFDISQIDMSAEFQEADITPSDDNILILRREILPSGRSRAFANDTPVSTKVIEKLAARVVDIHSQHRNTMIADPAYRLSLLDALAQNEQLRQEYRQQFRTYVRLRNELKKRRENLEKTRQEEEYIRFRFEKLRDLKLHADELEKLEASVRRLSNAAEIAETISNVSNLLHDDTDTSALRRIYDARTLLNHLDADLLPTFDSEESSLHDRLESVYIELKDIADTLSAAIPDTANPDLLDKQRSRIDEIYDAMRYFRVKTDGELLEIYKSLSKQLEDMENGTDNISALEAQLRPEGEKLTAIASQLTESRSRAALDLSNAVTQLARPLGMPNLNFEARLEKGRLTPDGQDICEFYCSFNKNQPLIPVTSGASGGELSRLMLCLKAVMASHMAMPTIIFDEIDTGVSGDIASRMGDMMRNMASSMQVIVITHLPQVAAKGSVQFTVYKQDTTDDTRTYVRRLSEEERVQEIARMLSGIELDEAALLNARSLLKNN